MYGWYTLIILWSSYTLRNTFYKIHMIELKRAIFIYGWFTLIMFWNSYTLKDIFYKIHRIKKGNIYVWMIYTYNALKFSHS